ncbi:NepR family anti-sigma factor [Methylobacterium sp. JK268]
MTEDITAGRPRGAVRSGRTRARPTPTIDAAGREDLGHALRRAYAELLAAPIPERFTTLLAALGGEDAPRDESAPGQQGTLGHEGAGAACDGPEESCP